MGNAATSVVSPEQLKVRYEMIAFTDSWNIEMGCLQKLQLVILFPVKVRSQLIISV